MIEEIKGLLSDLVRFRTYSLSECNNAIEYVNSYLKNFNVEVKIFEKNGYKSLVAGNGKIGLSAHLDIVELKRSENFFELKEDSKRFYGAGIADMKASCALLIKLVKDYPERFKLFLTCDEEIGGFNGAKFLAEKIRRKEIEKVEFMVVGECTNFVVNVKCNRVLWLRVLSKGKSAHASRAFLGKNAIEEFMNFYFNLKKEIEKVKSYPKPTINLGILNSGTRANVVPDIAEGIIDIRYPPEISVLSLVKNVKRNFRNVKIEVILNEHSLNTNPSNSYVRKIISCLKKENINPKIGFSRGSNDGRHYAKIKIPTIEFGPISSELHLPLEWVSKNSLIKFYNILKNFEGCEEGKILKISVVK